MHIYEIKQLYIFYLESSLHFSTQAARVKLASEVRGEPSKSKHIFVSTVYPFGPKR